MDDNFRKRLEENGADVDTTLKRFMNNEKLYLKFIFKFLDDGNYNGIQENIAKQNYKAVFEYAHSLKGVSSNLGLDPITEDVVQLTEQVRNKEPEEVDAEKVAELGKKLEESYTRFCKLIGEYRDSQ